MAAVEVDRVAVAETSEKPPPRIEKVYLNPVDFKEIGPYLAGCEVICREFTLREKLYRGLARLFRRRY